VKLLVDMNLSPRWGDFLRRAGFEALHWSSVGALDATDTEIMRFARSNRCIVLTHDLDFGAILAASGDHGPSVVQIRADDVRPDAIGDLVTYALERMEAELTRGALITIDAERARLRLLPLRDR
jgi:predicted nuclease of predicted toxin-antitoxin system